jgi:hypothetical protein
MMENPSLLPLLSTMSAHDRVDAMHLKRARAFALGSWAINFGCQLYGMLTTPNMKDIADDVRVLRHLSYTLHRNLTYDCFA